MLRRISIRFALTDDPAAAAAQRSSPVAKAKVSPAARRKAARKRTEDGQPGNRREGVGGDGDLDHATPRFKGITLSASPDRNDAHAAIRGRRRSSIELRW